jgi:hypothetical protein
MATPTARSRPIIFSDVMVRAILAGRKTQTRRTVKNPGTCSSCWEAGAVAHNAPELHHADGAPNLAGEVFGTAPYLRTGYCYENELAGERIRCPYGQAGDRLWVREAYRFSEDPVDELAPLRVHYRADALERSLQQAQAARGGLTAAWHSPIYMPRLACRLELEILSVRVERLQQISAPDAVAEGLVSWSDPPRVTEPHYGFQRADVWETDPRKTFARGWDAINGKRAPWASNPWVWVVEFRRA